MPFTIVAMSSLLASPSEAVVVYEPETGRAGARVLAVPREALTDQVLEQHIGDALLDYRLDPFERKLLGYLFTEFRAQHADLVGDADGLPAEIPMTEITPSGLLRWIGKGGNQAASLSGALRKLAASPVVVPFRDPVDGLLYVSIRAIFEEFNVPASVYRGLTDDHVDPASGNAVVEPETYAATQQVISYRLAPAFVRQLLGKKESVVSFDARVFRRLRGVPASLFMLLGSHKEWRPDVERVGHEFLDLPLSTDTWERLGITAVSEGNRRKTLKAALQRVSALSRIYAEEFTVIDSRGPAPMFRVFRVAHGAQLTLHA